MALRFKCSECGQLHRVPDSMGGRSIHCFSCGKSVVASTKNRVADDAPVNNAAGEIVLMGPLPPAKTVDPTSLEAQGLELVEDADDAPLKMADDIDGLPMLKDDAPPTRTKMTPVTPHKPQAAGAKSGPAAPASHNPRKTTIPAATTRPKSSPGPVGGTPAPRPAATSSGHKTPPKGGFDSEPLSLDDIALAVPEKSMQLAQPAQAVQPPPMHLPTPRENSQIVANVGRGLAEGWAGINTILDFLGRWFTTFYLIAVPIFIIAPWPLLAYNRTWSGLLLLVGISLSATVLCVSWIVCSLKIPSLWPGGWIGYLATFIGMGLVGGIAATVWPPAINVLGIVSTLVWLGFVVNNWDRIMWKCGRWLANCLASIVCLMMIWAIAYVMPTKWLLGDSMDGSQPRVAGGSGWSSPHAGNSWENPRYAEPANNGWTVRTDPAPRNQSIQQPAPVVSNSGRPNIFDNPPPVRPAPPARPTVTERPVPGMADPQPDPVTTAQPAEAQPITPPPTMTERPLPGAATTPPTPPANPTQVSERPLPGVEPPVSPPQKNTATVVKPVPNPAPAVIPSPVRPAPVVDNSPAGQLSRLGADIKANADEEITSVDLRGTSDIAAAAKILAGSKRIALLRLLPSQLTPDALTALKTIPSITRMEFSEPKLADTDLARVAGLSNVDELSLAAQPITSAGIRALSPMLNLKKLYLKGTKIDDTACPHLAKITSLRYLDLADTRVTSDGIEQLKPLKNLVGLVLTHTDVSDAAQQNLKVTNPRLNIIPP